MPKPYKTSHTKKAKAAAKKAKKMKPGYKTSHNTKKKKGKR